MFYHNQILNHKQDLVAYNQDLASSSSQINTEYIEYRACSDDGKIMFQSLYYSTFVLKITIEVC